MKKPEDKKEEEKKEDTNPFSSLFSFFKTEKKEDKFDPSKPIPDDSEIESVIRSQSVISSRKTCRKIYDNVKRVYNMPTLPPPFPL